LVLATDEVYSYAIFNYVNLQWTSHTEAGGDTTTGEGGVPAFVSIFSPNKSVREHEFGAVSQFFLCHSSLALAAK
jgi:hypothetical protein